MAAWKADSRIAAIKLILSATLDLPKGEELEEDPAAYSREEYDDDFFDEVSSGLCCAVPGCYKRNTRKTFFGSFFDVLAHQHAEHDNLDVDASPSSSFAVEATIARLALPREVATISDELDDLLFPYSDAPEDEERDILTFSEVDAILRENQRLKLEWYDGEKSWESTGGTGGLWYVSFSSLLTTSSSDRLLFLDADLPRLPTHGQRPLCEPSERGISKFEAGDERRGNGGEQGAEAGSSLPSFFPLTSRFAHSRVLVDVLEAFSSTLVRLSFFPVHRTFPRPRRRSPTFRPRSFRIFSLKRQSALSHHDRYRTSSSSSSVRRTQRLRRHHPRRLSFLPSFLHPRRHSLRRPSSRHPTVLRPSPRNHPRSGVLPLRLITELDRRRCIPRTRTTRGRLGRAADAGVGGAEGGMGHDGEGRGRGGGDVGQGEREGEEGTRKDVGEGVQKGSFGYSLPCSLDVQRSTREAEGRARKTLEACTTTKRPAKRKKEEERRGGNKRRTTSASMGKAGGVKTRG